MKKRYAMMLSAFVLAFLLAPAMHAKTYDVGLCSYDASNLADIKNTNLRECTDYLNEIRSVTPANTDPLLVASLLDTESNCNPRVNGGIAQVDATRCNPSVEVCPPTPIDEQIEAGLEVFDSNYKAVVEKGIGNKEQGIGNSIAAACPACPACPDPAWRDEGSAVEGSEVEGTGRERSETHDFWI